MKIKIILVVFTLIIVSSTMFTILSSRATHNNNKVFIIESFIEQVCKHEVPLANIAAKFYDKGGKGQPANAQLSLTDLDSLRNRIGQAYPKDFKVIQYYDLPAAEQQLKLSSEQLNNVFIVEQQHKKILNVLMNDTKIVSLNP